MGWPGRRIPRVTYEDARETWMAEHESSSVLPAGNKIKEYINQKELYSAGCMFSFLPLPVLCHMVEASCSQSLGWLPSPVAKD